MKNQSILYSKQYKNKEKRFFKIYRLLVTAEIHRLAVTAVISCKAHGILLEKCLIKKPSMLSIHMFLKWKELGKIPKQMYISSRDDNILD